MITITKPALDDACAAFVTWLTCKTQEGRASWEKRPNSLIALLPGAMFAQFITCHEPFSHPFWRLFVVRDPSGELMRTKPPFMTQADSPLAEAADALFLAATHPTGLSSKVH